MNPMDDITLSVTDFVAVFNQTLEYAYPSVVIVGELSHFRVSKGKWVYFDLKDEHSSVKFFGTVYMLSGPLEDGLMVQVRGVPRLHPMFGFSVSIQSIQPVGTGSLKKAASLLEQQLSKEGLFDVSRKRALPYAPARIGLIASGESAAYHDFVKILNERFGGLTVVHIDVQVQGEAAPRQIVEAIEHCNAAAHPVEVLVITRGGGSLDDLVAFNSEQVTRAVATSRIPTMVAIGHEVDVSLAELAADKRASTPSNAAELLVPDGAQELRQLQMSRDMLNHAVAQARGIARVNLEQQTHAIRQAIRVCLERNQMFLQQYHALLDAYSPAAVLRRGYAIVREHSGRVIQDSAHMRQGDKLSVELGGGVVTVVVQESTVQ